MSSNRESIVDANIREEIILSTLRGKVLNISTGGLTNVMYRSSKDVNIRASNDMFKKPPPHPYSYDVSQP